MNVILNLLLVEDNPSDADLIKEILEGNPFIMNGRQLSESLSRSYPDLKTLFMSGYTANVIAHRGVLEDGVFFMPKPFSKKELAIKVREVLEGAVNP
ncbi:MAG: hypothetical protein V1793_15640 [Pseudomonadota bacterium]